MIKQDKQNGNISKLNEVKNGAIYYGGMVQYTQFSNVIYTTLDVLIFKYLSVEAQLA